MIPAKPRGVNRGEVHRAIDGARLPALVKKYLCVLTDSGVDSGFRRLLKLEPARLLGGIAALIDGASKTLGVAPEEVLFATGFHPGNLAPERLEAALAELRTVSFLVHEGFVGIRLVPKARGRTADIIASKGGNTYAFEVRCVIRENGFAAGLKTVSLLEKKYRKKIVQAAASKKKAGFTHCGLVFVIDAGNFAPFAESGGLRKLAAALYEKVGRPSRQHLCLVSGGQTAVFPGWEAPLRQPPYFSAGGFS